MKTRSSCQYRHASKLVTQLRISTTSSLVHEFDDDFIYDNDYDDDVDDDDDSDYYDNDDEDHDYVNVLQPCLLFFFQSRRGNAEFMPSSLSAK